MLISQCVEDISRYAAGDMGLQHTTDTLINDMDRTGTLGIRSFIVNNSRAIRRRLFPDLEDFEHIGYDGGSKDKINRKRLIGNTYQIYRSILHQLAIDESWNNVYSDMTLPSGDMGTIKVERVDDDAKCGCVDNTATSSYWMLTNEYMVDEFDYAKELQPYKGMGLCSECGRLVTSPDGRDVVVPGKWHGKFPKKKATEEQLKKVGYKNLIR